MNIGYVTIQDSTNIRSFSGTGYYVPKSLEKQGAKLSYIGNLQTRPRYLEKGRELFHKYITRKKYWFNRNPLVVLNYARQVQSRLDKLPVMPDVLLSTSSMPLALFDTKLPVVLWCDAVFEDIIDFYPEFTNMTSQTIANGHAMEKSALERCSVAVYSSEWAARSAVKHYGISADKVRVVTYGANIETPWDECHVEQWIQAKSFDCCKLLFVGVDWLRKGGDIALETAKMLNDMGLPTELHVLGDDPPKGMVMPDFVKLHGFVSKETKEGKQFIHELISGAHFLILPTRADCTPIVYAEFNAFGIPVLTTLVGGSASLIETGKNGCLFPLEARGDQYAQKVFDLFKDPEAYRRLCRTAYQRYYTRLNWDHAGREMMKILRQVTIAKTASI